jgi:hypothetical protein
MLKTSKVTLRNLIRVPDTFKPTVEQTNGGDALVDVYFGANMDVLVLVAHKKKLSDDNHKRIHILTEER